MRPALLQTIRHLSQPTFYGGVAAESMYSHWEYFPSVSGHPTVKRKPRKVPNRNAGAL